MGLRGMEKRIWSGLLCLLMIWALLPAVYAEEASEDAPAEEETETAETAETAEKPEESVEENHSFLQKLWDGLLTAAPWILGGVIVILFITSVIFRIGKKKS